MKKHHLFIGYLALSIFFGTLSFVQAATVASLTPLSNTTQLYKEGEVIVVFKEGLSDETALSLVREKGMNVVKRFKRISSISKRPYMMVSGKLSTEMLISELKKNPNIRSASPNYRRTMSAIPNDPMFDDVWGLHNEGQDVDGESGTNDADIDGPEAWDTESNASDTVVAVFDTGVNYTHEDLAANMWINQLEANGTSEVDDDGNGYIDDIYGYDFAADNNGFNDSDPMDIYGHGSHVSGIIGAKGNNGIGIVGVNWDVKIMALKIFRPDGYGYDSDIMEAIEYILTMKDAGVNIVSINASYGGSGGAQTDPMRDLIQSLGDKGIVFAAAAGNEGRDSDDYANYPSSYDASNIIAVAATDQSDNLASYSNYGQKSVDLSAPGSNILSSIWPGNIYDYWSGTSMATPFVAGSVALIATGYPDENATTRINRILCSVDRLDSLTDKVLTEGRLNIYKLLNGDHNDPLAVNDTVTLVGNNSKTINVLSNDILTGDNVLSISADPEHGNVAINGTQIIYTPEDDFLGEDKFSYSFSDICGDDSGIATVTVTVTANTPPVAQNDTASIAENSSVYISVLNNDSDSDGHALSITAVTTPAHGTATISSGTRVIYRPDSNYNGADSFGYTVNDGYGGTDTATVSVTVRETADDIDDDNDNDDSSSGSGDGGGGGCTYNPHHKSFDLMFIFMLLLSLLYPMRHKYLK